MYTSLFRKVVANMFLKGIEKVNKKGLRKTPVKVFGEQVSLFGDGPQEGETKQGKGGMLTFYRHRWHLDDEYTKGKYKKPAWDLPVEFSKDPNQIHMFPEEKAPLSDVKEELDRKDEQSKELREKKWKMQADEMISAAKAQKNQFLFDIQNVLRGTGSDVSLDIVDNVGSIVSALRSDVQIPALLRATIVHDGLQDADVIVKYFENKGYIVKLQDSELGKVIEVKNDLNDILKEVLITTKDLAEARSKLGHDLKSMQINLQQSFPGINFGV